MGKMAQLLVLMAWNPWGIMWLDPGTSQLAESVAYT